MKSLREEIVKIEAYPGDVDKIVELCKQWALEMVGEDEDPSVSDIDSTSYNEAKQEMRDRINNETK